MSRNKKTVVALLVLVLIGGVAYALLPAGPDPEMVKVQQLQEKLFDPDAKLTDDERRNGFRELGEAAEKLTDEQRMQVMRENPFARRMRQRVVDYFDLPEDERLAMLDEHIDEFEKRRKEFEKRMADRGGERRGPPGGFNRGNQDPNAQNARAKRFLDHTSPAERAMFGEYFKDMQERRRQRGLPSFGGPFGG